MSKEVNAQKVMEERIEAVLKDSSKKLLYFEEGYKNYKSFVYLWCDTHGNVYKKAARDVIRYPYSCTCCSVDYSPNNLKQNLSNICKSRGWKFKNFIGEDKISSETRCEILCVLHEETFYPDVTHILANRFGCSVCRAKNTSLTQQESIGSIQKQANTHDTPKIGVLGRDKTGRFIFYRCDSCSYDEYVHEGVCNGVFTIDPYRAKKGIRTCRCSKRYRYTKEQREVQIKRLLLEIGGTWIGWVDENKSHPKADFNCLCSNGHKYTVSVDNFIRKGLRCNTCAKNGFDYNLRAELYITYWYGFGEAYLKTGITNGRSEYRVHRQSLINTDMNYNILYTFEYHLGIDAHTVEQKVKRLVGSNAAPSYRMPSGFTETANYSERNLNKILNIVGYSYLYPEEGEMDDL